MKAYSEDLRSRILAAVDAGMSKCEASRVFAVSRSTVKRYARQRRETVLCDTPAAAAMSRIVVTGTTRRGADTASPTGRAGSVDAGPLVFSDPTAEA